MRVVYLGLIPGLAISSLALGDGLLAIVLLVSAGASVMVAPKDRRDRLFGKRA